MWRFFNVLKEYCKPVILCKLPRNVWVCQEAFLDSLKQQEVSAIYRQILILKNNKKNNASSSNLIKQSKGHSTVYK